MEQLLCIQCNIKRRSKNCRKCWKCRQPSRIHSVKKRKYRWLIDKVPLVCTICGFEARYKCQLDIDHIGGNRENNEPSNLQVICANCHRLKTQENKDWANSMNS